MKNFTTKNVAAEKRPLHYKEESIDMKSIHKNVTKKNHVTKICCTKSMHFGTRKDVQDVRTGDKARGFEACAQVSQFENDAMKPLHLGNILT